MDEQTKTVKRRREPFMSEISNTPSPPYYAVIFSAVRTPGDKGYGAMTERMEALARQQDGFLGMESAEYELEITVSYWRSLDAIRKWKEHVEHQEAQRLGRERWYADFRIRVARVDRDYGM